MPEQREPVVFEEQQQFRQAWVWFAMGIALTLSLTPVVWQGLPWSGEWTPFVLYPWLIGSSAIIAATVLMYAATLRVMVDESSLWVSFLPLWRRHIALAQIVHAEVRTYRPLLDTGGWGVHYSPTGAGWVFNVSGNRGVQVELTNGQKLLIGSNHPEELAGAINVARSH
jgi:hypothetical protein